MTPTERAALERLAAELEKDAQYLIPDRDPILSNNGRGREHAAKKLRALLAESALEAGGTKDEH